MNMENSYCENVVLKSLESGYLLCYCKVSKPIGSGVFTDKSREYKEIAYSEGDLAGAIAGFKAAIKDQASSDYEEKD